MLHFIIFFVLLYVAFFAFLFLLPFIPGTMDFLTNNPNRYRPNVEDEANKLEYQPSNFGFFTNIEQGRVKVIVSTGGQFVRAIMDYSEHSFEGERPGNDLTPRNRKYWAVVETQDGARDSHPIPFPTLTTNRWYRLLYYPHILFWWFWKRYIYRLTGKAFFGVPPFRRIRTEPMQRMRIVRLEDKNTGERTIRVLPKNDYTDHYRVGRFQFPVFLPNVNCQNNIPVSVVVNFIGRVDNPWLTAFETEKWPIRLSGSISDAVTAYGRTHPVAQVLTATGQGADQGAGDFAKLIARIGKPREEYTPGDEPPFGTYSFDGSASAFGIHTAPDALPQIIDVSLLNADHVERLSAPAFAQAKKEADERLAAGQAAYTREIGDALSTHPEAKLITLVEGYKGVAAAAGDKAILNINLEGGSKEPDPTLAAILKTLKDK